MAKTSNRFPTWAILLIVLGVVFMIGAWVMGVYNGLVQEEGNVQANWAQVEVQYQRRSDTVAQLLPTVEATAEFEQDTLTEIVEARSAWAQTADDSTATIEDQIAATQSFDSAFSRLLVTVEAYPTLTATESFQAFQATLEGNENRIAVARKDFNDAAAQYNITLRTFPTKLIAGFFDFDEYPLLESDEGTEDAPEIEFNIGE
ncbi:MAG: LemA family protein [Patescibacteria group bacterium]